MFQKLYHYTNQLMRMLLKKGQLPFRQSYLQTTVFLLLFAYVCLLTACQFNLGQLSPTPPTEFSSVAEDNKDYTIFNLGGTLQKHAHQDISTLHVPIALSIQDIEKKINTDIVTGDPIHKDRKFRPGKRNKLINHKVQIWKWGDFKLYAHNNYVHARLPIKIKVGLKYGRDSLKLRQRDPIETEAELIVNARTKVAVNEEWQPVTHLEIINYTWVTHPEITLWGQNIGVKKLAEKRIKKLLPRLLPNLDRNIREKINIKQPLEKIWTDMQLPHRLMPDPPIYLQLKPISVAASELKAYDDTIKISVGVQVLAQTIIGNKITQKIDPLLPKLEKLKKLKDDFYINMTGHLSYEKASQIAQKELIGYQHSFKKDQYQIEVTDVQIYPSGDKLVAKLEVDGSVKGKIYFKGIPTYDVEKQLLYVKDFNFDINTSSVLVNVANWLQHRSFVKTINEKLQFPLGDKLDEAKCLLQDLLNNQEIGRKGNIVLNGHIDELKPVCIELGKEVIKAKVRAKGTAEMRLKIRTDDKILINTKYSKVMQP